KVVVALAETMPGFQELVRMRPVLRIIDDDELARRKRQRIGKRLWLGTRQRDRHLDYLHITAQLQRANCRQRFVIVALANQLYLQLRAWPDKPAERDQKLRHDRRFLVERDEHRIDRHVLRVLGL